MNFNKEDIIKIRKLEEILKRGYYADGKEVTDLHNRVLGTRLSSTNCSSCIKQRINALVQALNHFESICQKQQINASGAVETDEVDNVSTEEKTTQPEQKKRVGRKPKQ